METPILKNLYVHNDEHMNDSDIALDNAARFNEPLIEKLKECDKFCETTPCPEGCKMYVLAAKPTNKRPLKEKQKENGQLAIIFEVPVIDESSTNGFESNKRVIHYDLIILFDNMNIITSMFDTITTSDGRVIVTRPLPELNETHPKLYHMINTSKMSYDGDMSIATRHQGQIYCLSN